MTRKNKVLIVDDEPNIIRTIKDRLEANNFEVITAANGEEGLEAAKEKPDIILLDIMMPIVDGYDALNNLKSSNETKHIPVIMLTARGESSAVSQAFELGAADYIVKPINPGILIDKIRQVLS